MSGPHFGGKNGERNDGEDNPTSVTHHSSVTDRLDTIFELMSDAHRRYVLYYLFSMEGDIAELEEIANAMCNYESVDTDSDDCSGPAAIRVELHHSHLPKLAEAGVIDYDRRQGTVRFTPTPPLEEWVEHAEWKEMH